MQILSQEEREAWFAAQDADVKRAEAEERSRNAAEARRLLQKQQENNRGYYGCRGRQIATALRGGLEV